MIPSASVPWPAGLKYCKNKDKPISAKTFSSPRSAWRVTSPSHTSIGAIVRAVRRKISIFFRACSQSECESAGVCQDNRRASVGESPGKRTRPETGFHLRERSTPVAPLLLQLLLPNQLPSIFHFLQQEYYVMVSIQEHPQLQ